MDGDTRNERPLFQGVDEFERQYAPEELPANDPEFARVRVEGDFDDFDTVPDTEEPPNPAPVANVGTTPTGEAAPPNIAHEPTRVAPGDPQTDAGYPIGNDEQDKTH